CSSDLATGAFHGPCSPPLPSTRRCDYVGRAWGAGTLGKSAPHPPLRGTFSPRAGRRERLPRTRRGPTRTGASREAGVWTAGGMDAPASRARQDAPSPRRTEARARQDGTPPNTAPEDQGFRYSSGEGLISPVA